jgi:hypothetical protein
MLLVCEGENWNHESLPDGEETKMEDAETEANDRDLIHPDPSSG